MHIACYGRDTAAKPVYVCTIAFIYEEQVTWEMPAISKNSVGFLL